jgi:hypothetical protein
MPRFFEAFFAADPMTELSEADARAADSFVEEIVPADGPRHFIARLHRGVDRVVYPDAEPSPAIEAFHRERYPGVEHWITSTVSHDGDCRSYRAWYHDPDGTRFSTRAYILGPDVEETISYGPDGTVLSRMVEYYNEANQLLRSVIYDAAGKAHEYLPD